METKRWRQNMACQYAMCDLHLWDLEDNRKDNLITAYIIKNFVISALYLPSYTFEP